MVVNPPPHNMWSNSKVITFFVFSLFVAMYASEEKVLLKLHVQPKIEREAPGTVKIEALPFHTLQQSVYPSPSPCIAAVA